MVNVIWGSTQKPVASKQLADYFDGRNDLEGILYIGYPIIGTPEGAFPIDALLLSPMLGAVVFNIVEGRNPNDYKELQDESFTKLQAKLLQHKSLIQGRDLKVTITVMTFLPAITNLESYKSDGYLIANLDTISDTLSGIKWDSKVYYQALTAVIQAISTIRKGKKKRITQKPDSKGSKLRKLEDSIANLDSIQSAAVIETFEGVQRIRGLAGSGKTIVLALKVAYLHTKHPDWQIAVTFNTRSLKGQFERFINTFVIEQTNEEPDWEKIQIINAWGAPGERSKEGVYYNYCKTHDIEYLDFKSAQVLFGQGKEFDGACEKALQEANDVKQIYDAILVDEAQDFSPHFLVICYEFLKEPKRLIYAYDELQSLNNKALPSPEEIFGKNPDGQPRVKFSSPRPGKPKQDIILEKCYRNSRPVLSTAHALGFGVYRQGGLIQMFDQKELWKDIGYKIVEGTMEDGCTVSLARTAESSPEFLENHSSIEDLIQFFLFTNNDAQINWLVESIIKNLKDEELQPNDIIIINPDPVKTRDAVSIARKKLFDAGINSNLAGVSTSPDIFFEDDAVTFTGIYRAKGNEAAMVYVINAHECYSTWRGELARIRNRLFTAITRSKAWVRVSGFGKNMDMLISEFKEIKNRDFKLEFKYPTSAECEQLNIINRDMSKDDKKRIEQHGLNLVEIIESLEKGESILDDYPEEVIAKLRRLFDREKKK